jgi:DNA invertase Pin-like site-specific DNA recombinase
VWEPLEQAEARFVCAAEGIDTATGDHEMLFTIKAAIARDQWKRHRANWERARRSTVDRGGFPGKAATGYRQPGEGKPLKVAPREHGKCWRLSSCGPPVFPSPRLAAATAGRTRLPGRS